MQGVKRKAVSPERVYHAASRPNPKACATRSIAPGRDKVIQTDSRQVGRWELTGMKRVRAESSLPRTFQKDRQLDKVLIGESMCPVVRHRGSLFQIGRSQLRGKRVQLQQQKAKSSDVGRPAAQVPDQVLLQFIGRNLLPQSGERAGRFPLPASLDVIHWRRKRAIVIQEGTNVQ